MIVTSRDRLIIQAVGRFGQLARGHVQTLFFDDVESQTPCDRALLRLTKRKYLARIERRMVGGTGAGSGQYVYQLGSLGWQFCRKEGRYWPYRAVNHHMLAIADAYVSLKQRERQGDIEVLGMTTEPDTWQTIAGAELRPDLFVELAIPAKSVSLSLWVEIDMGTERQKQIKDKLARYWHAYQHAEGMGVFPAVLFLVPDEARLKELRWIIERGEEEARALFGVETVDNWPGILLD